MTSFGLVVIIAVATWLLILSVAWLVVVRQVAILNLRLERANQNANEFLENDGPQIGKEITDDHVLSVLDEASSTCIVLISATCTTCREIASELKDVQNLGVSIKILLTGSDELAAGLLMLIPDNVSVIRSPLAHHIASSLNINSAPFSIVFSDGHVRSKSYLFSIQTLQSVIQESIDVSKTVHYGGNHETLAIR